MTDASRALFAETVHADPVDLALACLLIGAEVEPTLELAQSLAKLDELAGAVDLTLAPAPALRAVLAGFTGDAHDYGDLRSSLLHEVLARRAGLPILLSVVWIEVARRRSIPAYGIGLPGHFIVLVAHDYVDPFGGGATVDVSEVPENYLRPWAAHEILLRILTNIRVWAQRSSARARVRLWAVELSLLLPHHPPGLLRERGHVLVSLGDFARGARDLEAYADAVAAAHPATAEEVTLQAGAARARLN